ncbi:FAD-dependent oxidoreductase [Vulcanisaeta distributa]|uniref:FAD-dependent oxidoreductase n=1 Tax=Vulcanisaeta distributa TaxID=164451 RepID=UPI001FB41FA7|nr:FAD-dependent oxidoreductase [Vulcanisaeta distributa]
MPTNRILILGGGIAGIEAALALANMVIELRLLRSHPPLAVRWRCSTRHSQHSTAAYA